tara:strand:- start:269 stop:1672 length:1404 start_codon:yes stop_codon:yes gene_type:complete
MALTQVSTGGVKDDAVTTDKLADAINTERTANTAKDLTALSASNLASGTVPDARFPATLPAASAANLTSIPAANITGDLPAISGANLTGISTTPADGSITQAKLNFPVANRNLIINGAMQVAQRGTSSTSTGYQTVDRISHFNGGTDENPTYTQADVASGTTPYSLGFRKSFKITNGNQTSGAGADDYIHFVYKVEAQDLANSGWNYTSSSSNITLSFWVKASVAQNYYGYLLTADGSTRSFAFETGSLSADTWTKVTVVIPGNSNLTFNNDNGNGLEIDFSVFRGTNFTGTAGTVGSWVSFTSSQRHPDCTPTWYTTNDATFELTGVQLEVGSVATDFEHRSFGQELALCQRYFYMHAFGAYVYTPNRPDSTAMGMATQYTTTAFYGIINFPVQMRAHPSFVKSLGTDRLLFYYNTGAQGFNDITTQDFGVNASIIKYYDSLNSSAQSGWVQLNNNNAYVGFDAEL